MPAAEGNAAEHPAVTISWFDALRWCKFAFGLDPIQNSAGLLPKAQKIGSNLVISFTQPAGVSGITYGAEWSQTLGEWENVTDTGIAPQHTFRVPIDTKTQLYMRLKVTGP